MCCCSGGAASTEALSQNMHTAFLAPPFLASVLFVPEKYCQTKNATLPFSGCSRFALSMSSSLIMWKKIKFKSIKSRWKPILPDNKLSYSNPSTLLVKSAIFPLHYTEFKKLATLQHIDRLAPPSHEPREVLGDSLLERLSASADPGYPKPCQLCGYQIGMG